MSDSKIVNEVNSRRTFAIISHPVNGDSAQSVADLGPALKTTPSCQPSEDSLCWAVFSIRKLS